MTRLITQLFDYERRETIGEILFYRAFELMIMYWVVSFAWKWGLYIQRLGDVVLPLGIANYIDISFMFVGGMSIWNAALITAAFLIGLLRLSRFGYPVAFLLMHLQYASRFVLGEISHGSNVIGFALLGMALAAVFFRNPIERRRFVLGFSLFFVGLGYSSAALSKLVASGPMWVDGSHLWMWIRERTVDTYSLTGVLSNNLLQRILLDSRLLSTLLLTFGLVTEIFGFTMWYRKRWIVMTLLFAMHIGILLTMKINFPANNAILIILAYPWSGVIDRFLGRLHSSSLDRLRRYTVHLA
jgi:hypothetical protein